MALDEAILPIFLADMVPYVENHKESKRKRKREREKGKKKRKDCTRSNKPIYQGCRIQLCFKILATQFENKIKKNPFKILWKYKIHSNKFNKEQNLNTKNCKVLLSKIEDLNEWREVLCSLIAEKNQYH